MLFKNTVKTFIVAGLIAVLWGNTVFALENSFYKVIKYQVPPGWDYVKSKERWHSGDPVFELKNSRGDSIRVTYYGLAGSRFKKPEEFEWWLDTVLAGKPKKISTITIAGQDAKSISLAYKYDENAYRQGRFANREYVYDEFIILPLAEGFMVLNLSFYDYAPIPMLFRPEEEWYPGSDRDVALIMKQWQDFLNSCKITSGKKPVK